MTRLKSRSLPNIRDAEVSGKTVLVRADLNVPLVNGRIADIRRIAAFAPTVADLTKRGARVVVMTHLGRPTAENNPYYSTRPVAAALAGILACAVLFIPDCVGASAERAVAGLEENGVAMLENLRFHKGEIDDSRGFAARLSVLGDLYVNDAFPVSHRAHASIHAIATTMPAYAGPQLQASIALLESDRHADRLAFGRAAAREWLEGRRLPGLEALMISAKTHEDA